MNQQTLYFAINDPIEPTDLPLNVGMEKSLSILLEVDVPEVVDSTKSVLKHKGLGFYEFTGEIIQTGDLEILMECQGIQLLLKYIHPEIYYAAGKGFSSPPEGSFIKGSGQFNVNPCECCWEIDNKNVQKVKIHKILVYPDNCMESLIDDLSNLPEPKQKEQVLISDTVETMNGYVVEVEL